MHLSIPLEHTVEFINVTEISPLISKCQIKVCYIGENRNKTFISKDVATEMGKKLPGSPIVGYFNQKAGDFEQHNREIEINDGKFAVVDTTRPYGFVDINARVWFQQFQDYDGIIREYLVTEGYIWTGVYPESQRISDVGNNQSMELKDESVKGYWTGNINSDNRFFIINEAIIEKLCILGEDFEPCFEGAQIKSHFSLEDEFAEFKNTMFSMISELKDALNKGGSETLSTIEVQNVEVQETVETQVEETIVEETVEEPQETEVVETPAEEYKAEEEEEKKPENKDTSDKEDSEKTEDNSEGKEEEEKKKYNLEEVVEYTELSERFETLNNDYSLLLEERDNLLAEIEPLRAFKLEKERVEKQAMIDTFYMLSEEDKADVRANIDTYSLDDIEAKLAVICVRNKVNFSLDQEEQKPEMTFNLNDINEVDDTPEWVKAVKLTQANI